jgi:hypothetical protein
MLKMVRKDVHQFELQGLCTPHLAEACAANSILFGGTINSVEDRHASKVGMAK